MEEPKQLPACYVRGSEQQNGIAIDGNDKAGGRCQFGAVLDMLASIVSFALNGAAARGCKG